MWSQVGTDHSGQIGDYGLDGSPGSRCPPPPQWRDFALSALVRLSEWVVYGHGLVVSQNIIDGCAFDYLRSYASCGCR